MGFVKLAKMAMVYVVGSIEDEWCFQSFRFLKLKLRNVLDSHLRLVVVYVPKGNSISSIFLMMRFIYLWMGGVEFQRYGIEGEKLNSR